MENYEELYKKALSRAAFYNNELLTDNQRKMLLDIFPELSENKDEKIRKELIEHIKANKGSDFVLFKKFSPDDVIAWLEKQGKALDPDKVIGWLVANICDFDYYVKRFKQDFGL